MATPFDRLMETIRPHLPGAIDAAIRQELFSVCEDFFSETNVWKETLDFVLPANSLEAEIMPYTGRMIRLVSVTKDDIPIKGVTLTDPVQGVLTFPTSNPDAGNYIAVVALTVSDPLSRDAYPIVPVDLMTRFWSVIMEGVIAKMMSQPGKPYSNPGLGSFHLSQYRGGRARAKNQELAGNTKNSQAWSFPQSFNRRK
ncbi:hypothetical protein EVB41_010 [Rhizobium phage RHph_TM3_14A]|nr:hypothetical protein EVB29_010 [Rhizobium phage RHph_TM27A]QIG66930.1 hypothetical protein EVB30_010 [Rhizobium phage RHph_TM27B]QIG67020.1 hypothetical protein EVB31_010 [Rhizobium phage RHph_TM29]QIG67475.1 hypothetical protein EVB41_010 [Rhizobium phage RHph_TM3_14A]